MVHRPFVKEGCRTWKTEGGDESAAAAASVAPLVLAIAVDANPLKHEATESRAGPSRKMIQLKNNQTLLKTKMSKKIKF
jgi:hypothetical protein